MIDSFGSGEPAGSLLAKSFDAVHFGFHQTSPVVATPSFPDSPAQPLTCSNGCIAMYKGTAFAYPCIFTRRYDWGGPMPSYSVVYLLGVISPVASHTRQVLTLWQLIQKIRNHGSVAYVVGSHANRSNLHGLCVNTNVQLTPLTTVLRSMLFCTSTRLRPGI